MEKTINNSATKKSVSVNANGAAAAFAKNVPQMYCKSEVVLDSQFVNDVVGGLVSIIFSGIEAGVRIRQENRKADDERALWLREHGLTAGEVVDILYVPGVTQQVQETVKSEVATPEAKPTERGNQKVEDVQQSSGQRKRRRGGRNHRKATQINNDPSIPDAAMAQKPTGEQVPTTIKRVDQSTVKRPRKSPVEKLKEVVLRDPELGRELMTVLEKHRVNLSELLEDD